jgi:hypothetical protein
LPAFTLVIGICMDDRTSKFQNEDVNRTERLIAYANDHGEDGLEEFARLLFPEWFLPRPADTAATGAKLELPSAAPETYQGLAGPETPPEFVQRVYGPWLGHGLTRAHIRKLDWTLYQAIINWLSRPQNSWPADVDLPTKAEQITRDLEALKESAPDGRIALALAGLTSREAGRIRGAIQRRSR